MSAASRPRRTDGNGVPRPVVRWMTAGPVTVAKCERCQWAESGADLALARLHVKTYPDHTVRLTATTLTAVYAETTDGQLWAEAVGEG